MISKINILEIRKDSLKILKRDSNSLVFAAIYYILPFAVTVALIFYFSIIIDTELFRNLIAGISLFSGLLFSIIFIVSDNYKDRRIKLNTDDDENVQYLKRYHEFSSDLVSLISYTIIKALFIIGLTVIISLYQSHIGKSIDYYIMVLWSLLLILLYHFLLYVIIILNEIYSMQYEEINRQISSKKNKK